MTSPPCPLHASLLTAHGLQSATDGRVMSAAARQRLTPVGKAEAGDTAATATYGVFVGGRSQDQSQLISLSMSVITQKISISVIFRGEYV